MGVGDELRFVLVGREKHALVLHRLPEQPLPALGVGVGDVAPGLRAGVELRTVGLLPAARRTRRVALGGPRAREDDFEHAVGPDDGVAGGVLGQQVREPAAKPLAEPVDVIVDVVLGGVLQGRQPGGHRDRVARKRPRLKDLPGGRKALDQLGAPADGADRETAADDLAERRQIRRHAEAALRTLEAADAEARDDLVEDEQRAVLVTQRSEGLVVAVDRHDDPHVAQDRLGEHRGDLLAVALEDGLDRAGVVERHRQGVFGERLGDARRRGAGVLGVAVDERRLLGPVVAALHDDDLVPLGVAAGEPNRRHRGLGAGVDEAQHLDARHVAGDELGEFDLDLRRRAVHRARRGV